MINGQRHWLLGGGIGSGKTAVRVLLEESGLETIDADSIGHQVLEPDGPAFADVARRWPAIVVEGRIDRTSLANMVFGDEAELAALEKITHPYIFGTIERAVQRIDGVVVVEVPLLQTGIENGWRRIVVDCDDQSRLMRLIGRGMTSADARSRMEAQVTRSEWLAAADLVVPNHGSLEELTATVGQLRRRF
ncbi:MAG: dephospho-CoA kinase [Acidimicrobiia bacterium]